MAVFTREFETRPWLGRVIERVDRNLFKVHWFEKQGVGNYVPTFGEDSKPYCSVLENESVISWGFSEMTSDEKMSVNRVMMEQKMSVYRAHDRSY